MLVTSMSGLVAFGLGDLNAHVKTLREALGAGAEDPRLHATLGMCLLRLGFPERALSHFEKAIEDDFEDSECYFHAAIASLGGKKAFLAPLAAIRTAERYLDVALQLDQRGIYAYFYGYLRFDYYERKSLNAQPGFAFYLDEARRLGSTELDIAALADLLRVDPASVVIPANLAR